MSNKMSSEKRPILIIIVVSSAGDASCTVILVARGKNTLEMAAEKAP